MLLERNYRNTGYFFIAVLLLLTWGFYKTYLIFFPAFIGFRSVQHLHGAAMMLWMLLLIIQPFLIRMNRPDWHRKIGKISYVAAPLVTASIFAVSRFNYDKLLQANVPEPLRIASLALNIPAIFLFAIFYSLAMIHRKDTGVHLRYMIGTGLLMIGPGLGRALIIYFNVPFETAVSRVDELAMLIAASLFIFDLVKKNNYKPYLTITLLLGLAHLCWLMKEGGIWQTIGKGWVALFF